MDVAGIEPGRDFRRVIDQHVSSCGVLLAIIGKGWADAKDAQGKRRLEDPLDFVRLETVSALKRDIPVVPVLVHGARMPSPEQLPGELADLAYRNGVELTHARWDSDLQVLIKALSPYVDSTNSAPPISRAGASSKTIKKNGHRGIAGSVGDQRWIYLVSGINRTCRADAAGRIAGIGKQKNCGRIRSQETS